MMREIEFWFDFASPYSHLTAHRIEAFGVTVRWRPFLLGPIFKSFGWDTSPFLLQKEKGAHMWVDMERQCRKYGIGWTKPSAFPRNGVLASRVGMLLDERGQAGAFCREIFRQNFVEDRDISEPAFVAEALAACGFPAAELIETAGSGEARAKLRAWTQEAKERGVFGAPTFFAGGEMYWGNDRLEDALA
jgi:2-hydroxychromene-2-carboxylate isomerase